MAIDWSTRGQIAATAARFLVEQGLARRGRTTALTVEQATIPLRMYRERVAASLAPAAGRLSPADTVHRLHDLITGEIPRDRIPVELADARDAATRGPAASAVLTYTRALARLMEYGSLAAAATTTGQEATFDFVPTPNFTVQPIRNDWTQHQVVISTLVNGLRYAAIHGFRGHEAANFDLCEEVRGTLLDDGFFIWRLHPAEIAGRPSTTTRVGKRLGPPESLVNIWYDITPNPDGGEGAVSFSASRSTPDLSISIQMSSTRAPADPHQLTPYARASVGLTQMAGRPRRLPFDSADFEFDVDGRLTAVWTWNPRGSEEPEPRSLAETVFGTDLEGHALEMRTSFLGLLAINDPTTDPLSCLRFRRVGPCVI